MNCSIAVDGSVSCKGWLSDLQKEILLNTEVWSQMIGSHRELLTRALGHRHQSRYHPSRPSAELQRHHAVAPPFIRRISCLRRLQSVRRSPTAAAVVVFGRRLAARHKRCGAGSLDAQNVRNFHRFVQYPRNHHMCVGFSKLLNAGLRARMLLPPTPLAFSDSAQVRNHMHVSQASDFARGIAPLCAWCDLGMKCT
jgi:hypothetical protein